MKKILSIVLVAGMLFSLMSTVAAAQDISSLSEGERALEIIRRADVDGDKAYSTKDAEMLLKIAAGITEVSDTEYYDIDLDGYVTLRDAQLMLKVASDIASPTTDEETIAAFNMVLNNVKSTKPGFSKTSKIQCPSIRVTTKGAPIAKLNVTNVEYSSYVNTFVGVMNSFPYNSLLDDEMKAELELMKQSATDLYKVQKETKTVAEASHSHYSYFPVNNLGWASKLTVDDIESVSYIVKDGYIEFTVNMADYNYSGGQYPTGTAGFSERQQLPYGKVFNLPALEEDDDTSVNSVKLKDGKIVLRADLYTGEAMSANYSYTYISDIVSVTKGEDESLDMRTVTTTNVTEEYVMNVG